VQGRVVLTLSVLDDMREDKAERLKPDPRSKLDVLGGGIIKGKGEMYERFG